MERCFNAIQDDEYGYLDNLGDMFDQVCGSAELCSTWADQLSWTTRNCFQTLGAYFRGASACLSALYGAGRYQELLDLVDARQHRYWGYDQWKARALVSLGRADEALSFASTFPEARTFREQLLGQMGRE